jgi:hypothetical protein
VKLPKDACCKNCKYCGISKVNKNIIYCEKLKMFIFPSPEWWFCKSYSPKTNLKKIDRKKEVEVIDLKQFLEVRN